MDNDDDKLLSFFSVVTQLFQSPFIPLLLNTLRLALLNINGGRGQQKRLLVSKTVSRKKLDVLFLQETHTDRDNEVDWGLWWRGYYRLSHSTNLSAGVAMLFSPSLDLRVTFSPKSS